jgi:hypothetical protein
MLAIFAAETPGKRTIAVARTFRNPGQIRIFVANYEWLKNVGAGKGGGGSPRNAALEAQDCGHSVSQSKQFVRRL